MGLDLTYVAGDTSHTFRLQAVDTDILGVLAKQNAEEVEAVIGVDDFGKPCPVSWTRLLQAIDTLLGCLGRDAASLPFVYMHTIGEGPCRDDRPGTGTVGGIRMHGDYSYYYNLHSGFGFCYLLKGEVGPDGRGREVERIDLRSQASILTDNMGEIKIYKRKKKLGLERHLRELKEFLLEHAVDRVTKTLG